MRADSMKGLESRRSFSLRKGKVSSIHCPPGRFKVCSTCRCSRLRPQIVTSSAGEVRKTDLIEITREGRVKELSFFHTTFLFIHVVVSWLRGKGGGLTMRDRLRSQFVTPGFERNSGHLSVIGSSLEIY